VHILKILIRSAACMHENRGESSKLNKIKVLLLQSTSSQFLNKDPVSISLVLNSL
jgi:hypothetical protein